MTKTTQNLAHSYTQKNIQGKQKTDIFCAKIGDIESIASMILERKERIFILCGAVGSGKTTLVQGVLSLMQKRQNLHSKKSVKQGTKKSVQESSVDFEDFTLVRASSPTFGIRNEYGNISSKHTSNNNSIDYGSVFHYDLYRIDLDYALEIGFLEWLDEEGWHFIEWGEEVATLLKQNGFECVEIVISEDVDEVLESTEKSPNINNLSTTITPKDSKRFYRFLS